jgi:hypothetical protein
MDVMDATQASTETTVVPSKKSSLMEIVARFREVLFAIDELDGEVTDALFVELQAAEGDLATKIDRCLWVGDEAGTRARMFRDRAKSLTEHARALEAQQDRLYDYVKAAMEIAKVQKLETENYASVLIKKNPASVDIEEPDVFAKLHKDDAEIVTWEPKLNKKAIGDRLKAGKPVEGAKLITNKTCLQVK